MASTLSPNMNLIVPGVGTEPGPTWASDLNSDLGILDQHNHSSGQGVQITPSGLNINSDLSILNNSLTNVNTVIFSAHTGTLPGVTPNLGCIYVAGNELVYNDESGNVVPITKTGSVNAGAGSITGLPSGTASASYSGGAQTFTWQSATSTPANMDFGSATLRNLSASAHGAIVNPPSALASDYSLTLPPNNSAGGTVLLTYDTSNNIGLGPSVITISPSGTIIMFGGVSAPTGYLLCDGTSYLRTTWPNLFAAIGTAYGTADSTHFNVPDFRGMFPRGVTGSSSNDPDSAGRTASNPGGNTGNNVGSLQATVIQDHTHGVATSTNTAGGIGVAQATNAPTQVASSGGVVGAPTSNETRPINLYVNFIIKT